MGCGASKQASYVLPMDTRPEKASPFQEAVAHVLNPVDVNISRGKMIPRGSTIHLAPPKEECEVKKEKPPAYFKYYVDPLTLPAPNSKNIQELTAAASADHVSFAKGKILGKGSFGSVFIGLDEATGEQLAIKEVMMNGGGKNQKKEIEALETEIHLLSRLNNPHIVRYVGFTKGHDNLNILMECVSGGSIASQLKQFGRFTETVVMRYTLQILYGLTYLHSYNIIHRDIKGANILVADDGQVKLVDFGCSSALEDTKLTSMMGTPYFMAPEVVSGKGYDISADIWSLGCTMLEMLTGQHPWSQLKNAEAHTLMYHIAVSKDLPAIPEFVSPIVQDFLLKCLQRNPSKRPTAVELCQHPAMKAAAKKNFLASMLSMASAQMDMNAASHKHVDVCCDRPDSAISEGEYAYMSLNEDDEAADDFFAVGEGDHNDDLDELMEEALADREVVSAPGNLEPNVGMIQLPGQVPFDQLSSPTSSGDTVEYIGALAEEVCADAPQEEEDGYWEEEEEEALFKELELDLELDYASPSIA